MKDLPNAVYAGFFVVIASALAIFVLYSGADKDIKTAVLGISASIVTGAFAYIQSHRETSNPTNPTQPGKE